MKILYVTDLHGSRWKYDRLLEAAQAHRAEAVINGGDMLPKSGDLFAQDKFITGYLDRHFAQLDAARIHSAMRNHDRFDPFSDHYLCYLGNDDLKIFHHLFETTCNKFSYTNP